MMRGRKLGGPLGVGAALAEADGASAAEGASVAEGAAPVADAGALTCTVSSGTGALTPGGLSLVHAAASVPIPTSAAPRVSAASRSSR